LVNERSRLLQWGFSQRDRFWCVEGYSGAIASLLS
jgi:hypothetical protein